MAEKPPLFSGYSADEVIIAAMEVFGPEAPDLIMANLKAKRSRENSSRVQPRPKGAQ